ncbi:MAG TPA: hypothetical protein VNM72_00240 [Blastocatellia bacterium]|nr:hypothetical protein [Blastocatellia bacterium]
MSTSLVELAQAYIQSEWPKRQARAEERLNRLNEKYGIGGDWRLIQPGPIAEACSIWVEETAQLGRDLVEHILNHPEARPLLTQADQVEHLRQFVSDWMIEREDATVIARVKAFMAARGIKGDQEIAIMRARAQSQLARARKEILLKIYQATRPVSRTARARR